MNLPFQLRRPRMAIAGTVSKIFLNPEGSDRSYQGGDDFGAVGDDLEEGLGLFF